MYYRVAFQRTCKLVFCFFVFFTKFFFQRHSLSLSSAKHLGERRLLNEKGLVAVTEAISCSRRCPRWYNQSFVCWIVPNSEIPSSLIAMVWNIDFFPYSYSQAACFIFIGDGAAHGLMKLCCTFADNTCLSLARCDKHPACQLKRPCELPEHFSPPCATL